MAEEWTVDLPAERGIPKVKGFSGKVLGGNVVGAATGGPFGFFTFEVTRGGVSDGPDNFEGYSGGGLWPAKLVSKEDRITVADVLLSGVIYYQSGWEGDRKRLMCHGRNIVYENALSHLAVAKFE